MKVGIIVVAAIAAAAVSLFAAWEIGWRDGHEYGRKRGWASGMSLCRGSSKWCEDQRGEAKAILSEPRRDIRWP